MPAIDAVCIIAQPTDLVYLYSYLRAHGIKVIAMDNVDDAGCAFIDEVIDLGIVLELKLPKQPKPAKPAPAAAEEPATTAAPAPQASGTDRTEELLREIELLRMSLAEQNAQRAAEPTPAPASEPAPVEEQPEPAEEPAPQTEEIPSIVDETKSLLDRIAEMREEQNAHHEESAPEPAPVEEQSEPVEEPAPQPSEPAPVAEPEPPTPPVGTTANDSDLIRRIEQIRQNSKDGDDDYIEEIRKLLDGLE